MPGGRNSSRHLPALLVLLLAAPAVWSQTAGRDSGSANTFISNCAESADDETGLAALEERCPGLTQALEESGYLPLLSAAKREELRAYELAELSQVAQWYRQPAAEIAIDVGALQPILDSLREQQAERPLTWLERFKNWLRAMLERQQRDADSWLSRWLEGVRIADAVSNAIVYGSIILIVALALAVLINELRAAGVFRRRRSALTPDGTDPRHDPMLTAATVSDLDAVAPAARAPLLLRILVSTLVTSGRLRTERSLTHSELGLRATFDDLEQRECFKRVAALAERVVYGADAIPVEAFEAVISAGRSLNARLGGAAA